MHARRYAPVHLCHRLEESPAVVAALPCTREILALTSANFRGRGRATQTGTRSRKATWGRIDFTYWVLPFYANCRAQQWRSAALSTNCNCRSRFARQYGGFVVVGGFCFILETLLPSQDHTISKFIVQKPEPECKLVFCPSPAEQFWVNGLHQSVDSSVFVVLIPHAGIQLAQQKGEMDARLLSEEGQLLDKFEHRVFCLGTIRVRERTIVRDV
jgi:hypothetical protein